jgi:histidinol-phosphate aminotransferase
MATDPLALVRPCIAAMQAYVPGEQPATSDFIKLNTNENPYPPPPALLERLREACGDDLRLYPDAGAGAVRSRLAQLFGVPAPQTIVGNGSDELLSIILRAFVAPGQTVAFPCPTYSYYHQLVQIQDGQVRTVDFPDDYSLPEGLERTGARVILLANPNAPSGTLLPLDQVSDLAARADAIVVLDEAYVDFASGGGLGLIERQPNIIVVRTMSKSYSLAGMRIGFAFAAPPLIAQLWKIKDHYNLNRLSLVAAAAALDEVETMRANARRICRTRDRLTAGLRACGFRVWDSQANFVLAQRGSPSAATLYESLKRRRILVRYFDLPRLRDCLRITVGTEEQTTRLLAELEDLLR